MNIINSILQRFRGAFGARGAIEPEQPSLPAPLEPVPQTAQSANAIPAATKTTLEPQTPVNAEARQAGAGALMAASLLRQAIADLAAADLAAADLAAAESDSATGRPALPTPDLRPAALQEAVIEFEPPEAARPAENRARLTLAPRPAPRWPPEKLSLALQGGGSFGAFTWGVLDRLLEEPGIAFDAVSGSSAGAVNAVLLAAGMMEGGREGARTKLSRFWRRVSQAAALVTPDSPLTAGLELDHADDVSLSVQPVQREPAA